MNMKTIVSTAVLATGLFSGATMALSFDDVQFYGGVDGKYNHFSHEQAYKNALGVFGKSAKNAVPGANLFIGTRLNENFGLEAGYEFMRSQSFSFNGVGVGNGVTVTGSGKTKYANTYVDAIGYIPLDQKLELMATLGLGIQKAKTNFSATPTGGNFTMPSILTNAKEHKAGVRVGGGVKYNFTDHISGRARLVYQKVGGNSLIKSGTSLGLGVLYTV